MFERCRSDLSALRSLSRMPSLVLAAQGLRSVLFGTEPSDPLVLGASITLMLVITALATYLPAREAARVEPSVLLRAE